ncbi:hypothetical protein ET495_15465 [Xylanimonas allomyrinae]|uniref:Pilus assembly protein TadE n=1 Tax=Xylanimonas allomyrinae TaxID=2509459 RepID=A0A4P6EPL0_9MICO|nr:hypothetical protein [Xylanimonas allomyrinae]QAY64375.1 hypothetical protein ET495_15465 [Xylanimonas allomyrinae]
MVFLLRQLYDLVLIDAGAHVTPVQAAAVEVADEVVQVVTPDLVSLRALRRNVGWWESLGVRKPDAVRVLVNRHTSADEVQFDAVRQLSPAPVLATSVPHLGRNLETAMNSRSPHLVESENWWRALRAVGDELHVLRAVPGAQVPAANARRRSLRPGSRRSSDAGTETAAPSSRAGRRAAPAAQSGAVSVELLGALPVLLLVLLTLAQLAAASLTYVWAGHGAAAAAREAAVAPYDIAAAQAAVREAVPSSVAHTMHVTITRNGAASGEVGVRVRTPVPLLLPGLGSPWDITVDRRVVTEP